MSRFTTANVCFPTGIADETAHHLTLDELLIPSKTNCVINKVSFESMAAVGINQGDYVIINRALKPVSGDIVVVTIDSQYGHRDMMGFMQLIKGRKTLCDAECQPIQIRATETVSIVGVVSGMARFYRS